MEQIDSEVALFAIAKYEKVCIVAGNSLDIADIFLIVEIGLPVVGVFVSEVHVLALD